MARISRNSYKGQQLFHVMVQGINKSNIYLNEQEKYEYIKLLNKYKKESNVVIFTYCMMNNHVHILLKVNSVDSLTRFMHNVNSAYAIYYNKNNGRVGYVYRNRFASQPITNTRYLYNCILYIHNNPTNAGIVNHAKQYKFSGYYKFAHEHNNVFTRLFNNKAEYEKAHNNRKLKMYFLEFDADREMEIKKDINDYLNEEGKSFVELRVDNELLLPIALRLKDVYRLSNVKIGEYLNVNREKIRRIL